MQIFCQGIRCLFSLGQDGHLKGFGTKQTQHVAQPAEMQGVTTDPARGTAC